MERSIRYRWIAVAAAAALGAACGQGTEDIPYAGPPVTLQEAQLAAAAGAAVNLVNTGESNEAPSPSQIEPVVEASPLSPSP